MQNFRTYQLALAFARKCADVKLTGSVREQFEDAVLSIVLNLAEGSAKPTLRDQRKFYFIALGSLRETQAILALKALDDLAKDADKLGAHIYKLAHQDRR